MARIKKDSDSWKAGGILRRDFKQDKSFDGPISGPKRKKNKRKWCRGQEGREHILTWKESKHSMNMRQRFGVMHATMEIVCERCGRVVDTDWDNWSIKWIDDPPRRKREMLEECKNKLYGRHPNIVEDTGLNPAGA